MLGSLMPRDTASLPLVSVERGMLGSLMPRDTASLPSVSVEREDAGFPNAEGQ